MPKISNDLCIGCEDCEKFCTGNAIEIKDKFINAKSFDSKKIIVLKKKAKINTKKCFECYACLRNNVCKMNAIKVSELDTFYKQFQHIMSDPVENNCITTVPGRGTEEVKTNDVTGRIKKGELGICIDMGRPGVGTTLRDVEKVAKAIVKANVKLLDAEKTPLSVLMKNLETGEMYPDCLDYKVLSVIIEGICKEEDFDRVMESVKQVSTQIDTVFSLGVIAKTNEVGETNVFENLEKLGIQKPIRVKATVGLGKPLCL